MEHFGSAQTTSLSPPNTADGCQEGSGHGQGTCAVARWGVRQDDAIVEVTSGGSGVIPDQRHRARRESDRRRRQITLPAAHAR